MTKKQPDRTIMDSGFADWTAEQLPDLSGKRYLITGGNSGIGFETAKHLGNAGGDIVIACRSPSKAEAAAAELRRNIPGSVDIVSLDLADLSSVREAAATVHERYSKIDGLINNAGIMHTPQLKTADGFELQVGTNHLGHFLWAGLLIDLVEAAEGRVVVLSSVFHKGEMSLDDLMSEKKYSPDVAYRQSKGANLMFALELDRKLKATGSKAICIACHPGYSATNIQGNAVGFAKITGKIFKALFAQSPEQGALPSALSAAGVEAKRGGYYGAQKMGEYRGPISDALVAPYALDEELPLRLWDMSEELVGYRWDMIRNQTS